MSEHPFITNCRSLRNELHPLAGEVRHVKELLVTGKNDPIPDTADKGEAIANLVLAYRHLEDAHVRLGKAIEAFEGHL